MKRGVDNHRRDLATRPSEPPSPATLAALEAYRASGRANTVHTDGPPVLRALPLAPPGRVGA